MAQVNNTYDHFDSNRNRETLSDLISMISPEETPFYSLVGTEKIDGVKPEWNTDSLATPATNNAQINGDTYTFNAITATTKVGNYTQIFRKSFIVSNTQEAVSKAGPKSDYNREMLKKGVELRTDIEVTAVFNQASSAGSSAAAATLGGLRAWLYSNDSMGAGGSSGAVSGAAVTAATNGTQRALTKTLLDDTIQTVYQAGGNPTVFMVSPYLKRVFSSFMSDANVAAFRTEAKGKSQGTIYGAADVYVSDFGNIDVVPNRQWARVGATVARNAFLLEPAKLAIGVLRPIKEMEVGITSDAKPGVLLGEATLIVKNEAANGVIADLYGMTSST
jgi:hypothetical protein